MGGWSFMEPRLLKLLASRTDLRYVGRAAKRQPGYGFAHDSSDGAAAPGQGRFWLCYAALGCIDPGSAQKRTKRTKDKRDRKRGPKRKWLMRRFGPFGPFRPFGPFVRSQGTSRIRRYRHEQVLLLVSLSVIVHTSLPGGFCSEALPDPTD